MKQVCGPTSTSWGNGCNVLFPSIEERKVDYKIGVYETNNQTKRVTFKYEQERRFCLGVANVESKDGTITGKRCPVSDYTDKKIVTIDAYKKYILNEFARISKLTSSSSPWVEFF